MTLNFSLHFGVAVGLIKKECIDGHEGKSQRVRYSSHLFINASNQNNIQEL